VNPFQEMGCPPQRCCQDFIAIARREARNSWKHETYTTGPTIAWLSMIPMLVD